MRAVLCVLRCAYGRLTYRECGKPINHHCDTHEFRTVSKFSPLWLHSVPLLPTPTPLLPVLPFRVPSLTRDTWPPLARSIGFDRLELAGPLKGGDIAADAWEHVYTGKEKKFSVVANLLPGTAYAMRVSATNAAGVRFASVHFIYAINPGFFWDFFLGGGGSRPVLFCFCLYCLPN